MSSWQVVGLDGDPTPGDPDRTAELAGRLLHEAGLADRGSKRLSAVASGAGDLHMEGGYAAGFRQMLSELPGELGKLSGAYRVAGEALRAFASDLRQEKARAGQALRQGTDASVRYDGAMREIRSLLPGQDVQPSALWNIEYSVEQATEGLDESVRSQARAAARRAHAADQDQQAARRLAEQAVRLRGEAEQRAVEGIARALNDSGIKNRPWWKKALDVVSWPFTSWDHFVSFCRGAAFVVGIVALFVSGPVGWALVGVALAAGAVAFGDTLVKFTQGKASLADLALDALGLIPGTAGAIRLAGLGTRLAEAGPRLLAMARDLPETGRVVLRGLRGSKTTMGGIRRFRPSVAAKKIPASWGEGQPIRKGKGWRWDDGNPSRNSVRVDKGNPNSPHPSQQVDHVRVNSEGRVLGRDGKPIPPGTRIRDDPQNTHIPLSEYEKWKKWNKP
ncbi:MAG TPA: hypothetical protein VII47_07090 [Actinomycetota bacterium]